MDLIFMNEQKEDVGVMKNYELDLAFGSDENNFVCKLNSDSNCCEAGFYLYIDGTEYGGMIDSISVDTSAGDLTYTGRTWHGILNSKVLEPNAGNDYLILSGDANTVLSTLLSRMNLTGLFSASSETSGITISNYKMNRYISGYDGIMKMLRSVNAKLTMTFTNGFVVLSSEPAVDYSEAVKYDNDMIDFKIKKNYKNINHVICLGKGDLHEREVVHVYADTSGNISTSQTQTGMDEITAVYDNANAESTEELTNGGIKVIQDAWNSDEVNMDFNANDESYDICDMVGAIENTTGIEVVTEITKKIVKINDSETSIEYKLGV